MKIERAIEILDRHYILHHNAPLADLNEAALLGIEALKFKQSIRAHTVDDFDALLPGETE